MASVKCIRMPIVEGDAVANSPRFSDTIGHERDSSLMGGKPLQ